MVGVCAICDNVGPLTRDHVPPQKILPPTAILVHRLTEYESRDRVRGRTPRKGHRAPHFQSICQACNRDLLGSQYDPALIDFANRCRAWVNASSKLRLQIQGGMVVDLDVSKVVRSVFGHLLAAEERADPSQPPARGTIQHAMQSFLLDQTTGWPTALNVYCWPYAGSEIVIARGFALGRILGETYGPIVGDVLKFFPLAFWVTPDSAAPTGFSLVNLAQLLQAGAVGMSSVSMPLRPIPPSYWPERPGGSEVVAMNDERMFIAKPRARRLSNRGDG